MFNSDFTLIMSQNQELVPTVYEDKAEMLNGHNGDVPPQLRRPQILMVKLEQTILGL